MYIPRLAHVVAVFTERFSHTSSLDTNRTSEIEPQYNRLGGPSAGTDNLPDNLLQTHIWHQSLISCPRCAKNRVTRSPRIGVTEKMLSAAYVYPFVCRSCHYRFRWLVWGKRYARSRPSF
ncbi:MAG: hypothetical protein FJ143_11550 [Deltaproteobacteria bacterium]|nr:hypothetical protein [Deltaproteobacteria bacterium]MBM4298364.1 hypothetical protein [Deltaproteobacteria bacterium]